MFRKLFGTTLLGVAAISGFVMGCTTGDVEDSPTPSPSPEPEVAPFTVDADCTAGGAEADDVVYLSLDTSASHLALSGVSVELYDDPTKGYCDPIENCYGELHSLELFLYSGTAGGSDYYETWERELSIAVDGEGVPNANEQVADTNTVFTCDFFSNGEVTWVFYGTDASTAEEHCIAGGKAPETYAPDCEVSE